MKILPTFLIGILLIGGIWAVPQDAGAAQPDKHRGYGAPPHASDDDIRLSEVDHHLTADTVHTLPLAIALQFPPDSNLQLEKIAIYGTDLLNVGEIEVRHLRVGYGQARPIGSWDTIYDINSDGHLDLIFVVLKRKLEIEEGDRFLIVSGHTSGSDSETFQAAAPLGATSEIATSLFLAVAKGAAGELGQTGTSYALSALGIGGESSEPLTDLAPIVDALAEISNQIEQLGIELNSSLNLIQTEIQELDCDNQFTAIHGDIAQIITWSNILSEWSLRTKNGEAPPHSTCTTPDIDNCIETFVSDIISGTNSGDGVKIRMSRIHTELVAGGGLSGLLGKCINTLETPPDTSLNDQDYYAKVHDLIRYFFGVQVQAINLYAEARHYRAWQEYVADGNGDPGVTEAPDVCNNAPAGSDAHTHCSLVKTELNRLYSRLQTQFSIAGAPYSQGKVVKVNNSNYLWPLNLDDFQASDGFSCSSPNSAQPCGTLAGTWASQQFKDFSDQPIVYGGFGNTSFAGYEGWKVAGASQWTELLQTDSRSNSQTIRDFLTNNLGFASHGTDRVFLTNDIVTTRNTKVVRWLDENYSKSGWQFVGSPTWSGINSFMSMYSNSDDLKFTNNCVFQGRESFINHDSRNQSFYRGYLQQRSFGDNGQACELFHPNQGQPGFLKSQNRTQLRHPVLDISELSCGEALLCGGARSPANPAGVPSMCGADFDSYFEIQVPMPTGFDHPGC